MRPDTFEKIEWLPIDTIKPSPYNPRIDLKPTDPEYRRLKRSIEEFGLVEPLIVNKFNGNLIGGHQRLKIMRDLDYKIVPAAIVNINDALKEKALNIALNKIEGQWDEPRLSEIFREFENGFDLSITGFEQKEIDKIFKEITSRDPRDPDIIPDIPMQTDIKPGNMFQLGSHRLICGDSTDKKMVESLVEDNAPILMVTDPPYGVNYDARWREDVDLGIGERSKGLVLNDDRIDWSDAYSLFSGSIAYIWHAGKYEAMIVNQMENIGFDIISQIIWVKQHFVISRGDYHWQHEPCLYMVRKGEKHNWKNRRDQTTIWNIQNNNAFGGANEKKYGHSTQKPVECMLRPILNNTDDGDYIYDPFLGSGTTLIAAEMSRRRCLGIEINPIYCAMIIKRWTEYTGKEPLKIA